MWSVFTLKNSVTKINFAPLHIFDFGMTVVKYTDVIFTSLIIIIRDRVLFHQEKNNFNVTIKIFLCVDGKVNIFLLGIPQRQK